MLWEDQNWIHINLTDPKSANRLFHVWTLTYSSPYKWLINDRSRLGRKVQGVGCISVKFAFGRNVGNHTCVSCATEGVLKKGLKKERTKCHTQKKTSDSGKSVLSSTNKSLNYDHSSTSKGLYDCTKRSVGVIVRAWGQGQKKKNRIKKLSIFVSVLLRYHKKPENTLFSNLPGEDVSIYCSCRVFWTKENIWES